MTNWFADPYRRIRLRNDPELLVCMVGESKFYGSINEYEAIRMPMGQRIRYCSHDGKIGIGIVNFTWFYDGPMMNLHDGTMLWLEKDVVVPE